MRGTAIAKFLALIVVIIGVFVAAIVPLATNIKQGLDLQGGTHIVLEAEDSDQGEVNDDSINRAIKILERRVNEMGFNVVLLSSCQVKMILMQRLELSVKPQSFSLRMIRATWL